MGDGRRGLGETLRLTATGRRRRSDSARVAWRGFKAPLPEGFSNKYILPLISAHDHLRCSFRPSCGASALVALKITSSLLRPQL